MGMLTENSILAQNKKGQRETNDRLDAIQALLVTQNELLARLVGVLGDAESRPA